MNRRTLIAIALTMAMAITSTSIRAARPNIVFILADDHTTQAISCYGGLLAKNAKTQHIDRLASQGQAARRTTLKLEQINQRTFPHDRLPNADDRTQRRHIYQQYIKSFLRCGRVLDENVGRLLHFLDESEHAKDTIVIYTADQGHFLGEHGFFSKRFMYEESMRVPFIIRFPDRRAAGTVCDDMISNVDFAPTLLALASVGIPSKIQGRSFAANLQGATPDDWPTAVYYRYWQHLLHRNVTAHYGIRTRWDKLIYFHGQPRGMTEFPPTPPQWEYYDLSGDPGEMHNLINDERVQDRIAELKRKLALLQRNVGDKPEEK